MKFEVRDSWSGLKGSYSNNRGYLIVDNWDDWFTYSTMYDLYIVDNVGISNYIGKIKIGEHSMSEGQRRPNIPNEFDCLDKGFFSLGQTDFYYDNLKKLGKELRTKVLVCLNDIAFNSEIYESAIKENVTHTSLLRDISTSTVQGQFRRIANGGARLTQYYFKYTSAEDKQALSDPMELSFKVIPESNPPTNIHVIIGRNGVGKTRLIKNMISSIIKSSYNLDGVGSFSGDSDANKLFANVICVAFSAFDEFYSIAKLEPDNKLDVLYENIGLPLFEKKEEDDNNKKKEEDDINSDRLSILAKSFSESLNICINGMKRDLWEETIETLESDPIFKEANVRMLKSVKSAEFEEKACKLFSRLSSGHKIILLTITKLVEKVEEKSLIFLDEPEGHLHPPLLSAFVRALSQLLIKRNGVAIIATHSPVVLQEVPRSCVWKLRRSGREALAERLNIESFGENIGALTREVFGYEVTYSGFHKLLREAVDKYKNYDAVLRHFNSELGMEARAILKALIAVKEQEEE